MWKKKLKRVLKVLRPSIHCFFLFYVYLCFWGFQDVLKRQWKIFQSDILAVKTVEFFLEEKLKSFHACLSRGWNITYIVYIKYFLNYFRVQAANLNWGHVVTWCYCIGLSSPWDSYSGLRHCIQEKRTVLAW